MGITIFLANATAGNGFFATEGERQLLIAIGRYALILSPIVLILFVWIGKIIFEHHKRHFRKKITVANIMNKKHPSVKENQTLKEAYDLMLSNNINVLPVLAANFTFDILRNIYIKRAVIGLIRMSTIEKEIRRQEITSLTASTIKDFITEDFVMLQLTDNVSIAYNLFQEKDLDLIVAVGYKNRYFGIVTKSDIPKKHDDGAAD